MYTIRKTYKIEYAHQLKSAYTACCHETIHGHSGVVEVFFASDVLDENNMVIDFGYISEIIKKFIVGHYDHALWIPMSFDKEYINCLKKYNKKLFLTEENPTAEFFARGMFLTIVELISKIISKNNNRNFYVKSVRFHETETGYAEFDPYENPVTDGV